MLLSLELKSLVVKHKEIEEYQKQISDLEESKTKFFSYANVLFASSELNIQRKISRAKTLEFEKLHQKESLTDKEEVPKPTKEIKRPPG